MERNAVVDVLKFIFSLVVVFFHFYQPTDEHFSMGFVSVEFFAIISGVYFFQMYEQATKRVKSLVDPFQYVRARFFRFLPYTTLAFLLTATVRFFLTLQGGISALRIWLWTISDVWEVFLIKIFGLNNGANLLNAPAWYIGAMLIVNFTILNLLNYWGNIFKNFIMPITILIGYGYWSNSTTELLPGTWIGFTTFGILRLYLVTCLSYYVYCASKKLKTVYFTRCGKALLTVLELSSYLSALTIMTIGKARKGYIWILIIIFMIGVSITCSGVSYSEYLLRSNKVTTFLGKLSLSIYLVQQAVLLVNAKIHPDFYVRYSHKMEFLLALLIVAVLFLLVAKKFVPVCSFGRHMLVKFCVTTVNQDLS